MESNPLLVINDQPLSVGQALRYLQAAGQLQPFVGEILRQYVLDQEIKSRDDLEVSADRLQQAIIDFRLQQRLTDPQQFQQWLNKNGLNFNQFQEQVKTGLKREVLKQVVTESQLDAYFQERKPFLDSVVLSRIVVPDKELADVLQKQIVEEKAKFESLAKEQSITDDRNFNGMMGALSVASLPDPLKAAINSAIPGEVLGPIEVEGYWCLFRFEQHLTTSLENPRLKQQLQNELFERWTVEIINKLTVKLEVKD